jgi:lipid A 3-O-deacylase
VPSRAQGLINEVKLGGLYHDVPDLWSGFSLERPSVDLNGEVLFSPYVRFLGGTIRPALGGTVNFAGGASKAYLDARWEIGGPSGIFFALGVGAAIHNGTLGPTEPDRKALGSRVLFHFPAELGWRWDGHNSLSLYFEHISNGYTKNVNEGLDGIGVRYGYRF